MRGDHMLIEEAFAFQPGYGSLAPEPLAGFDFANTLRQVDMHAVADFCGRGLDGGKRFRRMRVRSMDSRRGRFRSSPSALSCRAYCRASSISIIVCGMESNRTLSSVRYQIADIRGEYGVMTLT